MIWERLASQRFLLITTSVIRYRFVMATYSGLVVLQRPSRRLYLFGHHERGAESGQVAYF